MRHSASMIAGSKSVLIASRVDDDSFLPGWKTFMTDWEVGEAKITLKGTYAPGLRNPGMRNRRRLPKGVLRGAYLYLLQIINEGNVREPMKSNQIFKVINNPRPFELYPDHESVIERLKS